MGVKRRKARIPQHADDDVPEEPVKKPSLQERQCAKTDPYEAASKSRDDADNVFESNEKWIDILATHLASEPKFIKFMQNPQPLEHVTLNRAWLAAVHLPGRYEKFTKFEVWYSKWYSGEKGAGFRLNIIRRGAELVLAATGTGTLQQHIETTLADLPLNDAETQVRRDALFEVQNTRQKLIDMAKRVTDTQHGLAKELYNQINSGADEGSEDPIQSTVQELGVLEQLKASTKSVLSDSALNAAGVKVLDDLLTSVPDDEDFGVLYLLEADQMFPVSVSSEPAVEQELEQAGSPGEGTDDQNELDAQQIASIVQKNTGIAIDFLLDKKLDDVKAYDDVFALRQDKLSKFKEIQTTKPLKGSALLDGPGLKKLDGESAKWLQEMFSNVNMQRFSLNFRDFEKTVTRPEDCVNAAPHSFFWGARHRRLDIARDNIVHVRRLVAELVENDMIANFDVDEKIESQLQLTLRRMYALLAVMFGCCAEGAIMLTIMDHLLEELGSLVIGTLDPKLESNRMQKAATALHRSSTTAKSKLNVNDFQRLEREHKAREVFAEVARFYRGAVMLLFVSASYRKSNKAQEEFEQWYNGLVAYIGRCGHSSCGEQLKVRRLEESEGGRAWALSVAVRDARLGSTVSTNRKFAYGCFYELVAFTRYHVGLVPFFHYFAHLWHPACRPFRGKAMMIDDITVLEGKAAQTLPSMDINRPAST
ncbi:hypothetical protein KC330_g8807 [Hortaea werneckii]|nr:hypothetical protein KC330_g8807 [Hortaea werneckii]